MKKASIVWTIVMAIVVLTAVWGCIALLQYNAMEKNPPAPVSTPAPVDPITSGKISDTAYEGELKFFENNIIVVTVDGEDYTYQLSDRAKKDIEVLQIVTGDTVVVQFERNGGILTAVKMEKVISKL